MFVLSLYLFHVPRPLSKLTGTHVCNKKGRSDRRVSLRPSVHHAPLKRNQVAAGRGPREHPTTSQELPSCLCLHRG